LYPAGISGYIHRMGTILNLQVLRGFAAMGVVFYHTAYLLPGDFHTEFFGVPIFFVISGFIMSYITQNGEHDFLLKRLIRIVPIYWFATFLFLLTNNRLRIFGPKVWLADDPPLYIDTMRSFFFLPCEKFPVLGVGWTLNFEMYFYLVFAGMLMISRRWAPVLTIVFLIGVIYVDRFTGGQWFLIHYYSHEYIDFFVRGIAVYYLWAWFGRFSSPIVVALCLAVLVVCFAMHFARPLWSDAIFPWLWVFPTVVVASVLFIESGGLVVTWRPLLLLGDASYSIYLTHTTWLEVLRPYIRDFGLPTPKDSFAMMFFGLTSAALVGIAIHLWVEKPMLRKLRTRLLDRQNPMPIAS